MKKPNIEDQKRTRLKTTWVAIILVTLLSIFPTYIILEGKNQNKFNLVAEWSAWGICVSGIVGVAGYYVNKETRRSSLVNIGLGMIRGNVPQKKELTNHEDKTDPENIPL